jgi:hypothetical protein
MGQLFQSEVNMEIQLKINTTDILVSEEGAVRSHSASVRQYRSQTDFITEIDGTEYLTASLICHAHLGILSPLTNLYELIIPIFKNGNRFDLTLSNLVYIFKKPVECSIKPGYYHIPLFTRYVVNKEGKVWSLINGIVRKTGLNNRGYTLIKMSNDRGVRSITESVHRSEMLAVSHVPENYRELEVNHIDHNKENNNFVNLEWCTPKQNMNHSFDNGERGDQKPVLIKDLRTSEVQRFRSLKTAGRSLGYVCGSGTFTFLNNKVITDCNKIIKYDDGTPWPDISEYRKLNSPGESNRVPASLWDVIENTHHNFTSGQEAARFISNKLGNDSLRISLSTKLAGLWNRHPIFGFIPYRGTAPKLSDSMLVAYRHIGRVARYGTVLRLRNQNTGVIKYFNSWHCASRFISPNNSSQWLAAQWFKIGLRCVLDWNIEFVE